MKTIESRPRAADTGTPQVRPSPGLAVLAAVLGPLGILAFLLLVGVNLGAAVLLMFAGVFAVTTTMDVRWLLRSRGAADESSARMLP